MLFKVAQPAGMFGATSIRRLSNMSTSGTSTDQTQQVPSPAPCGIESCTEVLSESSNRMGFGTIRTFYVFTCVQLTNHFMKKEVGREIDDIGQCSTCNLPLIIYHSK